MVKIREFRGIDGTWLDHLINDRNSLPDQRPDGSIDRNYPQTHFFLEQLEFPEKFNDASYAHKMLENAYKYHFPGEDVNLRKGKSFDEQKPEVQDAMKRLANAVGYEWQRQPSISTSKDATLDDISPQQLSAWIDIVLDNNHKTRLSGHERGLLKKAVEAHDPEGKGVSFKDGLNGYEKARLRDLQEDLRGKATVREVFKAPEAEAKTAPEKKDTSKAQPKEETRDEPQEAQPRPLRELIDIALDEDFRTKHLSEAERELLSKEVEDLTGEGVTFGKKLFGERINDEERARLEQLRDHLDGKAPKVEQSSTGEPSAGIAPLVEVTQEELPPLDDTAKQPDMVVEQRSPLTMDPVDSISTTPILSRAGEIDGPHDYLRDLEYGEVHILQQFLSIKGIDPGPIDGKFGEKTMAATEKYITDNNLDRNISFTDVQKHLEGRNQDMSLNYNEEQADHYAKAAADTDNIQPEFQSAALDPSVLPEKDAVFEKGIKLDNPIA